MLDGRSLREPSRPVRWLDVRETEVDATDWPRSRDGELSPLKGSRAVVGESGLRWSDGVGWVLALD